MIKEKIYNLEGKEAGEIELDSKIFDIKIRPSVVQQVVEAYLANRRSTISHAKTISEVRGGGKKPWKQKGTGRARQGSIRSNQWKGGGVVFGPSKDQNFEKKINQKVKTKALFMVLTDKLQNQRLKIVESLDLTDKKTKNILSVLKNLELNDKKILISKDIKDDNLKDSTKNLKTIKFLPADSLNVYTMLKYEYLILTKEAINKISKHFLK